MDRLIYDDEKEIIYIRENSINKEFYYKYIMGCLAPHNIFF